MADQHELDEFITDLWLRYGGTAFRVCDAYPLAPKRFRDGIEDKIRRRGKAQAVCMAVEGMTGRVFAQFAAQGQRTASGFGLVKLKKGYRVVSGAATVQRVDVVDTDAAVKACADIELRLQGLASEIATLRLLISGLSRAIIRPAAPVVDPDEIDDPDYELLGAIARMHADNWQTFRQLRPIVGFDLRAKSHFHAIVGRTIQGLRLESGRHATKGWQVFRVGVDLG